VGNQRKGVLLAGDGPESAWLYDFACGEAMTRQAELQTDVKFGPDWKGGGFVHPDGRVEIRGPEGP
jgi:hypothetical protein